jgi:hypothetical protein
LLSLLTKEWKGKIFVNPPYSNIENFMDKALLELRKGNAKVVVFLLPSATSTPWWHNYVVPFCKDIRWIKGRLKFANDRKGERGLRPSAAAFVSLETFSTRASRNSFRAPSSTPFRIATKRTGSGG